MKRHTNNLLVRSEKTTEHNVVMTVNPNGTYLVVCVDRLGTLVSEHSTRAAADRRFAYVKEAE